MATPPSNIFPTAVSVEQPTASTRTQNQSATYNYAPPSNNAVVDMQRQIIGLHSALKGNSDLVQWFSRDKEPEAGSQDFRQGPYASLQFMLNRYVDKAAQRANQYNINMPDASQYAMPGKQLPRSSFLQYLDMLKVVGSHGAKEGAGTPDGKWGEYTNNALKAAWSIGYAMTTLASKFGEKLPLTSADLAAFSALIPGSDKEKTPARAAKIASELEKITKSINAFTTMMLDSSHNITGDKRFNVFSGTKHGLSQQEQERFAQLQNELIPGLDKMFSGLRYKDIATPDNFKAWMTGKEDIGRNNWQQMLEDLKRQLTLAIDKSKAVKQAPELMREGP